MKPFMASAWHCLPIQRHGRSAGTGQPVAGCGWVVVKRTQQPEPALAWCRSQHRYLYRQTEAERLLAKPRLLFPAGTFPVPSVAKPRKHSSYLGTCERTTAKTLIELYAAKRNLSRNKAENGTEVPCLLLGSVLRRTLVGPNSDRLSATPRWCTLVIHATSVAYFSAPIPALGYTAIIILACG